MKNETLEWLDLSPPPEPTKKKLADSGIPPCPICGWPIPPGATACDYCGHSLNGTSQIDAPAADLEIDLPAPVIEVEPAPERWFNGDSAGDPTLYNLRLQAERMRVTTGFDRLICLDDISVEHYQHQLEAALRALRDLRGQALLADEVGLGKTIEAGLVMKELIERGLVKTILIITPASLTWQWHEEMASKFYEEFTVLEKRSQLPAPDEMASLDRCRWIISLDRAKMGRWAERLLAREYDLLIIDEAHKLKNHRTQAHRFVNQIRKRYVLMLTATPVHNDLLDLYNLVTILRPGHLGTRAAFRENFIASGRKRRVIYCNEDQVPDKYLNMSQSARHRYRRGQWFISWLKQRIDKWEDLHVARLSRQQQAKVDEIKLLLAQGYTIYDFEAVEYEGRHQKRRGTAFVCRLELEETAQGDRSRRVQPHNPSALRGLLREVMIRNRRASVGVRFPPRKAAIYNLNLTPPERELYDRVTAYIRRQMQQVRAGGETLYKTAAATKLALMTLQKQLCSSPQAVARTLRKMVDRQTDDAELAELLVLAWGIERGRKVEAVLQILADHPGKFLIFTDYLPTVRTLRAALKAAGHEVVYFHGGLSALERAETVRAFRSSARIMISTRSGGEGHNLQFCHQMINYDLPWNPMRIEQRVGRLHRLGQKNEVTIFNLAANDTIEAYVLDLLAHKIRMFELVIGELDLILGELGDRRSFEQHIEAAWASSYTEEDLLAMLAELEAALVQSKRSYQEIQGVSDELSVLLDTYEEWA